MTATLTNLPYNRQDWQGGYRSQYRETAYWIESIDGEIPPDLEGTLFRNGPGLLDVCGTPIHHPFDGDGMVCAVTFKGGRAHFQNRYVRTEGYIRERAAGKSLYRGVFGTQKSGGWLANLFNFDLKNIANTNVIYWGDRLLALWEAAQPYRLDPSTLETLGLDDLDGLLAPGDAFAAHPRIDPNDGEPVLVNFAIKPGLTSTIVVYELDTQGKLLRQYDHSVPGFAFIHDFAITPNYSIFFQNPVSFNPFPFALGLRGAAECIQFDPQAKTRAIVLRRDGGGARTIEVPAGFVFHHANAFEGEAQQLCVDSICYASFPEVEPGSDFRQVDFENMDPPQLWRFELDLARETATAKILDTRCCEFPRTHPDVVGRPYRYLFLAAAHNPSGGNAPHQALFKVDVESDARQLWTAAPERGYVGEPVFVPRPGATAEDDGWAIAFVYNAATQTSDVVVLDGRNLARGPIATLHLQQHVPYGLHGNWVSQCFV